MYNYILYIMNVEYENKYFKYKNKYIEIKKDFKGGVFDKKKQYSIFNSFNKDNLWEFSINYIYSLFSYIWKNIDFIKGKHFDYNKFHEYITFKIKSDTYIYSIYKLYDKNRDNGTINNKTYNKIINNLKKFNFMLLKGYYKLKEECIIRSIPIITSINLDNIELILYIHNIITGTVRIIIINSYHEILNVNYKMILYNIKDKNFYNEKHKIVNTIHIKYLNENLNGKFLDISKKENTCYILHMTYKDIINIYEYDNILFSFGLRRTGGELYKHKKINNFLILFYYEIKSDGQGAMFLSANNIIDRLKNNNYNKYYDFSKIDNYYTQSQLS